MLLLEFERLEPKPPKPLNREFIKSVQCSENDNGGGNWGGEGLRIKRGHSQTQILGVGSSNRLIADG